MKKDFWIFVMAEIAVFLCVLLTDLSFDYRSEDWKRLLALILGNIAVMGLLYIGVLCLIELNREYRITKKVFDHIDDEMPH